MARLADRLRFARDHRWTPRHASDYIDGDLSPEARRRVERHTGACPECHALVDALGSMVVALGGIGRERGDAAARAILVRVREELGGGRERPA